MTVRRTSSSTKVLSKNSTAKGNAPKKSPAKKSTAKNSAAKRAAKAPKATKAGSPPAKKKAASQSIRDAALLIGVIANIDDLVTLGGLVLRGLGLGFLTHGKPVFLDSLPTSKRRAALLAVYTLSVINSHIRRMAPELQLQASRDKRLVRSLIEIASDPLNATFEQMIASQVEKWALLKSVQLTKATRVFKRL